MKRILYSPEDSGGGGSQVSPGTIVPAHAPVAPPPPIEPPAPPPAATTVLQGTKTERELELEKKLREREIELSHVQDENHRLKQVPASPTPATPAEDEDDWTAFKV